MKIAIAQFAPEKGNIQKNIQYHLRFIETALSFKTDVIFFPELSITGYEPDLAKKLAININDKRLNIFQNISDEKKIIICLGAPTKGAEGIYISMIIFQPHLKKEIYSKQFLHDDELPYFKNGTTQKYFTIKDYKIAPAICYESLLEKHAKNAKENGANIYIASVAKPQNGVEKAYFHLPRIAKKYSMPILMSNCIGLCDNFVGSGHSAVWNEKGELVAQLDDKNEGIIIYDSKLGKASII